MDVESRNISTLANSRVPEMLGTFHLDDHKVQEWSDASLPGMKHKARKEVGKWVDPDRNADIHFQRHEDSKQSEKTREQQRTEVIQGNAPDSAFQIVRSQRQFQDTDQNSGRVTTMSTSYQMSSTRGTRSTTKTTSNKTTTKTVTVSGGIRTDDFETLKMSFQPLDSSTQREKINVSRSGTMGVRRPPTRRHTPVTITAVSPDHMEESDDESNSSSKIESKYEVEIFDDTPESRQNDTSDPPSAISMNGIKNISPKIRVGFPVEIQLELQSKFRFSGNGDESQPIIEDDDVMSNPSPSPRDEGIDNRVSGEELELSTENLSESKLRYSTNSFSSKYHPGVTTTSQDSAIDVTNGYNDLGYEGHNDHLAFSDASKTENVIQHKITLAASDSEPDVEEVYDYTHRRQSYGFEPFDARRKKNSMSNDTSEPSIRNSPRSSRNKQLFLPKYNASPLTRRTPPSLSKSWDIIQGADDATSATTRKFSSSSSTLNNADKLSLRDYDKRRTSATGSTLSTSKIPRTTIVTIDSSPTSGLEKESKNNVNRDASTFPLSEITKSKTQSYSKDNKLSGSVTNLSFQTNGNALSNSVKDLRIGQKNQFSRRLNESRGSSEHMHTLSSGSALKSRSNSDEMIVSDWKNSSHAGQMTNLQNDIDELNESLSKILQGDDMRGLNSTFDFTRSVKTSSEQGTTSASHKQAHTPSHSNYSQNKSSAIRLEQDIQDEDDSVLPSDPFNKGSKEKAHQISHTWISPVDQKPSQHARDSDVTTSITGTNDQFKKSSKKVEFCKTEVHFTPESGKFNIVESVENKPSTVHLFRRRKKHEKKGTLGSGVQQGETSRTGTPTPKTPTSEDGEQDVHDENSEKRTSYYMNYHTISEQLKSRLDSMSKGDSNEGPELVSPAIPMADVGGDEQSFFHHWNNANLNSPNDVRPEVVTPAFSAHHPNDSTLLNFNQNHTDQTDEQLSSFESLVEPLKLRRDINITQKLLSEDFHDLLDPKDKLLYNSDDKFRNNNKDFNPPPRPAFLIPSKKSALIKDLLEDLGVDGDEGDENRTEMILSNYGELKIQRYLKQLKSPSSHTGSDSSADLLDVDPNEAEIPSSLRHDNILYENGSFIPLATRKSLIEMNNRNRKRTSQSNQSDRSSTTSTFSLPHSDRDSVYHLKDEYSPFRLPTMEATVSTKGDTPKITSVDLRYTLDDNPKSYPVFPDIKRSFVPITKHLDEENSFDSIQTYAEPIMKSRLPPTYRSNTEDFLLESDEDYRSMSPLSDRSSAPASKPTVPIPILPSQFLDFEKTGAALRERSNAKTQSFATSRDDKRANDHIPSSRPQSKSVVTIGQSDAPDDFPSVTTTKIQGNQIINETKFSDKHTSQRIDEDTYDETMGRSDPSQQEPILSLDHTWKGPAHFEHQNQFKNPTGVARSMTFPKTSKPEPEWVQKAKSRESRVTDWNLVGKQQAEKARAEDPPWLNEVRIKPKPMPPGKEYSQSIPQPAPVYPWQKNHKDEDSPRVQSPIENTDYQASGRLRNDSVLHRGVVITEMQENTHPGPNMGIHGGSNGVKYDTTQQMPQKIFLDSNRDSDSLLVNPPQISIHGSHPRTRVQGVTVSDGGKKESYLNRSRNSQSPEPDRLPAIKSDPILVTPKNLHSSMEQNKLPVRKPLHISTNVNTDRESANDNSAQNPKPRTLPKPPRPPERISSLSKKAQVAALNGDHSSHGSSTRKSPSPVSRPVSSAPPHPASRARMPTPSNRTTPVREIHDRDKEKDPALKPRIPGTPEFQHPLVKVTKIPTVSASRNNSASSSKIPSPRGDSRPAHPIPKSKAKHHVAVVNETKISCKSKLLGGPSESRSQPHSPISGIRSLSASPKSIRTKIVNGGPVNAPYRKR